MLNVSYNHDTHSTDEEPEGVSYSKKLSQQPSTGLWFQNLCTLHCPSVAKCYVNPATEGAGLGGQLTA